MNCSGRYLIRLLGRDPVRSLLSVALAALLAFAFGLVTVLRGIYGELYQQVEVRPVFTGISYSRAQKTENSGYVRSPYYEYVAPNTEIEMGSAQPVTVFFVNRLDELVQDPVIWDEEWDEESFFRTSKAVCLMNEEYARSLGKGRGDKVRINEAEWLANISMGGNPFQPGETLEQLRDRRRPFAVIAGLIQSDRVEYGVYVPVSTNALSCLYGSTSYLCLDIARYTLNDYHQAAEFREYAGGILDGETGKTAFSMDTSYADRIYEMHRLLETLYPITVGAALLLGGVLPGLTVLHASRQISVLRALGTGAGKCVGIYALAQTLCALAGLLLGLALVLLLRRPDLPEVLKPFGIYLAAHLAACALGSGIFAWLCARKHVLVQLQAKE